MKKLITLGLCALFSFGMISITGCEGTKKDAQNAVDKVEEGAKKTGEAVKEGAKKAGEAVKDGAEAVKDAVTE